MGFTTTVLTRKFVYDAVMNVAVICCFVHYSSDVGCYHNKRFGQRYKYLYILHPTAMSEDDTLDEDNVTEERLEGHLPKLHVRETGAAYKLRDTLNKLDGPMAVSNALIPMSAHDIGDVSHDPNPSPRDLGHAEGYCTVEHERGRVIMCDGPTAVLSGETYINAAEGDVIDDVTNWA